MNPLDQALALLTELADMRRLTSVEVKVLRDALERPRVVQVADKIGEVRVVLDLSSLRQAHGMTQRELADLIGAHFVTVCKLEKGKLKLSFDWAERLAPHLGVEPLDLFLCHNRQIQSGVA